MLSPFVIPSSGVNMVRDHRSDWVISTPSSEPAIQRGVEEIQRYVERSTAAKLPIVTTTGGRSAIIVRTNTALREEEYTISVRTREVLIEGGGRRGALYGCYGFLRDAVGCRWFTRTIERVPKRDSLVVAAGTTRERPAFEYREPYFAEAFDRDWAVHNRVNGTAMRVTEADGGKVAYGHFVHTFSELVPPAIYFKDHPEYFSLVKGARQSGYAQLCLTNPDVERIVIEGVKRWIREMPTATIFSVSQNDTYLNCECDACRAIAAEEASPSGPLLRFVNRVADAVGRDYPNVLIDTLAYQWSEKPPQKERPHKNVRVRLAPIDACFSHPLNGCDKNASSFANLNAWSKITNQLYIWHYCTDFANYLQPLPDLDEIGGDVKLFRDRGVVGLFYEGAYADGGGGEMSELKSYLLAELMWNPDRDPKAIVSEFLAGVYGAAAPMIQTWLDATHRAARTRNAHATIYDPPTAGYLSADVLAVGVRMFDAAEWKVRDDPGSLEQVQKARMALEYVQLRRMAANDPGRKDLVRRVADKIRRFGVTQTSEGGPSENFLRSVGAIP